LKKGIKRILESSSSKYWLEQIIDTALTKSHQKAVIQDKFHASWAGMCPRLIQLTMNGIIQERIEPRIQRIFDVGWDVHIRYGRYFEAADIFINREIPIEIKIDDMIIIGKADFCIKDRNGKPRLIELKSINSRGFEQLLVSRTCKEDHFLQWNIYSKGLCIPEGDILYENKDDQRIKIFPVNYDDSKFQQIANKFMNIHNCNKENKLISKPLVCPDQKYCIAKSICSKE